LLNFYSTVNMSGPKKYSRQEFLKIFPSLVEDIKEAAAKYKLPQNAMDWLEKVRLPDDVRASEANDGSLSTQTHPPAS
jgi:hypothetical protein